jgi:hypothetical protein
VNVKHFRLGTRVENQADARIEKRGAGRKKLSRLKADAIRGLHADFGFDHCDLAMIFGVSNTAIDDVIQNKSYWTAKGGKSAKTHASLVRNPDTSRETAVHDVISGRSYRLYTDTVSGKGVKFRSFWSTPKHSQYNDK